MRPRLQILLLLFSTLILASCAGKVYTGDNASVRTTEYISLSPTHTREFKHFSLGVLNFKPPRDTPYAGRFVTLAFERAFHMHKLFFRVIDIDDNTWYSVEPHAREEDEIVRAIELARQQRYKYLIVGYVRSFIEANNDSLIDTSVRLIRTSDGMTLWYGDITGAGYFNGGDFDWIYPSISETAPNMSELALRMGREATTQVHEMYQPQVPDSAKPVPARIYDRLRPDENGQWR